MPVVKRSTARSMRSAGHCDQIVQPIKEEDLLKIKELLREESEFLTEYVESLCLFRMSVLGYADEDKLNAERLDGIIDRFDQDKDIHGKVRLPDKFEIARDILLRMKEKRDFDRVLEEVRSIA